MSGQVPEPLHSVGGSHTIHVGPPHMSKYDDRFDETAPDASCFADTGALDPLATPAEIYARGAQERELATLLNGVHDGSLPPTVSLYGPPGTGKTLSTRRVCREFADRTELVAVEYVNLKECCTLCSATTEICDEFADAKTDLLSGYR
jgi:archaeal cell division control protein 6